VIVFGGEGIVLDVEGTTSSISFVYDVLFEFAKKHVAGFLSANAADNHLQDLARQLADDAGVSATALDDPRGVTQATLAALDLMNRDVKSTPLKAIQGMIWQKGFDSGELVSHVFDDVAAAIRSWSEGGLDVRIYSSGSVQAQKLFFSHTSAGDLTPYLHGHYDTTTGPKRNTDSYRAIAADMGLEPRSILFVSDVGEELDAARAAGMATALAVRPGNKPPGGMLAHEPIESFAEIVI
jgi:enolase-phosphatase E1